MCPNHRRLPLQDTADVTRLHLAGAERLLHRDTGCGASTEGLGAYSDLRVTQKGTHIDPNNGTRAGYLCVFLCIPNPNRVKAKERETGSRSTGHHRHRAWGKGAAPFDGARQK